MTRRLILIGMFSNLTVAVAEAQSLLDHRKLLEAETFWDNRDFGWFEENIPFLDTPDAEINTTYYYRWELVTKHCDRRVFEQTLADTLVWMWRGYHTD